MVTLKPPRRLTSKMIPGAIIQTEWVQHPAEFYLWFQTSQVTGTDEINEKGFWVGGWINLLGDEEVHRVPRMSFPRRRDWSVRALLSPEEWKE